MGAEIDRLELQVEAQATKANNQLDKLVTKLDRVSGALSHLNSGGLAGLSKGVAQFAQASTQLSNVKTADFTRLAKNIERLSNLNTKELYGASHAMRTLANSMNSFGGVSGSSVGITNFASSIAKLGGVNVARAITNLPALAKAMNDLMATLSRAPQVSKNIIDMTNALANLAAQGSKVGTVSNGITKDVNRVGSAMSVNAKKSKGLASIIGSMYQKFYWVSRGINKLWDSIENSMGYVETLNYFDAAFGQVADIAVSQWQSAGYASAEEYYNSFSDRAKELTSKMTGFNVNDDGTLTATGSASLGINPNKLMNYQATFAQMSSSMGVASETSLKVSQALTEIGADLASVKNMDFDKVWKDMASGLAGMSRTLYKYGVNIRNVNLQQKLFDLGINENITNLNQNDKALLRAIILLDSTRYAWGDLADTINQPANQLRLLQSNFSNLSRTVGNLFLPLVQKVLPYVNGLVIAVQRLFTWIGTLMGIDLSGITSAIGSSDVDMSELLGDTDDLTDSLGDASEAAKKLKSNLQGFDELNVITTQTETDTSGLNSGLSSGLLDKTFDKALSEYQKAWDDAFANMENRANEFADKFEVYLQPIKNLVGDFVIGDYFNAGQDTSKLVAGIFKVFENAIEEVDWNTIGQNVVDFFVGIDWGTLFEGAIDFQTALEDAITEAAEGIGIEIVAAVTGDIETYHMDNTTTKRLAAKYIDWFITSPFTKGVTSTLAPTAILLKSIADGIKKGADDKSIHNGIREGTSSIITSFAYYLGVDTEPIGRVFDIWWEKEVTPWFSVQKWMELASNIGKGIKYAFDNFIKDWVKDGITNWQSKHVLPYLTEANWKNISIGAELGLKKTFMQTFDDILKKVKDFIKTVKDLFSGFNPDIPSTNIVLRAGASIAIPQYCTGGFPEDGFFFANHSEMIGRFSNGKTAVANNEQITEGIAIAVQEGNYEQNRLLREQNELLRAILEKEVGITNDEIFKSVRRSARDYTCRTGNPAFS